MQIVCHFDPNEVVITVEVFINVPWFGMELKKKVLVGSICPEEDDCCTRIKTWNS